MVDIMIVVVIAAWCVASLLLAVVVGVFCRGRRPEHDRVVVETYSRWQSELAAGSPAVAAVPAPRQTGDTAPAKALS